ncbi:endonuclease [Fragilaria crotonensis]|nr:endonuclease [Fragilaria crotonensis]
MQLQWTWALLWLGVPTRAFSPTSSYTWGRSASSQFHHPLWMSRDQNNRNGDRRDPLPSPNGRSPNPVGQLSARHPSPRSDGPTRSTSREALELSRSLAKLEAKYNAGTGPRPEPMHYVALMRAWAESGLSDGPQQAARLLEGIETFDVTPGYQDMQLSVELYLIVIKAFAHRVPSLAEMWLGRMESRWRAQRDSDEPWSGEGLRDAYNICLDSWSRFSNLSKKGRECPPRALALLQKLKQLAHIDHALRPDTFSFTCLLQAFARTGDSRGAKQILSEMEKIFEEDPSSSNVQPDSMAYSLVVNALAASNGGEKAALDAEALLRRMVHLHSSGINRNVKPNAYTYEAVITAWAKSRTGTKGAKRAEAIFEHMNKLYESGNHDAKPLTININAVVKAWSVCRGGVEAATRCEAILRRMDPDGLFTTNNMISLWPSIVTFNNVISAWANAGSMDSPVRAEDVLTYLDAWNTKVPKERKLQATIDTYNMIIASYARSRRKDSARRAEALLYRLVNLGAPDDHREQGVEKAFGMVVSCWSKSSDPNAPERAEQLLKVLQKNHNEGGSEAKPNVIILSQVIDLWSKSKKPGAARKAKAIFDQFLNTTDVDMRPNTITFNSMLNALANSNTADAVKDSEKILDHMYALRNMPGWDVEPNSRSIVSYMTCLAKLSKTNASYALKAEELISSMLCEVTSGNVKMMPDSFSFATAINAWVWSSADGAAQGVLRLIDRMETLYFDGITSSPPHAICYNTAVRFFIDSGDLRTANAIVGRMESAFLAGIKEAAPDRLTYAALLNAYAQSSDDSAHERATELFSRQQQQAAAGNAAAKPKTVCYNMVMASLAKNEKAKIRSQALKILDQMKILSRENDDVKPDAVSFSTAINVLSKSQDKDSSAKAIMLLTEMEARYRAGDQNAKPNLFSFNSVLNALSKTRTKAAAMKAEELLLKMRQLSEMSLAFAEVRPDLLSYTSVIEAWAGVEAEIAPERAESILREMSEGGDNSIQPDVVSYNKVLLAWVRHSNPGKADALLREMEKSSEVDPDAFSYKTVLLGWAQQNDGAAKAEEILIFLEHQFLEGNVQLKPDELCYKAVMAAFSETNHDVDKLNILSRKLEAFQKADDYGLRKSLK